MTKEEYINPQRDRASTLFLAIVKQAKENGDMAGIDPILDYTLPNEQESTVGDDPALTHYEFDVVPVLGFGCEGIYIDCYLHGKFDDSGRDKLHIGTIKTLREDLDACKLMGKLCGILMYHAFQYINKNIHRYTPKKELEIEYERKHPTIQPMG